MRERLADTFASYTSADLQRALLGTLDLFHEQAIQVAATLHYAYPEAALHNIRAWLVSANNRALITRV